MKILVIYFLFYIFRLAKGGPCDAEAPTTTFGQGNVLTFFNITVPISVTNWTITFTFSIPVLSLQPFNAVSNTTDNINFQFTNMNFNGIQTAGSFLNSMGFSATYNRTASPPNITSIQMNGISICGVTTSTTTALLTTSPTPYTATPQPAAACNGIIAITTTWAEGFSNTLKIPMPNPGSSQAINLTLLSSIPTTSSTYKLQIKALPGTCSTETEYSTTPVTTTSTTTVPSTTTIVPIAPCNGVVSTVSLWPGSFMAFLNVTVPVNVTSWTMVVTFSSPISGLQPINCISNTSDNINFQLNNTNNNGVQTAGNVFNSVGLSVSYPSSISAPNITAIQFNGINICLSAQTTTTQMTTLTTTPPNLSCNSAVTISSSWRGGFVAFFNITIPYTVSNWTISLTFSSNVSTIQALNAMASSSDNINFQLNNMNFNGAQTAGSILNTVGFSVGYPCNTPPRIASIQFNGIDICSSGFTTTTPMVSTTPMPVIPTTQSLIWMTCYTAIRTTTSWPGGYASFFNITIPFTVSNWTIDLTFTSNVTSLQAWNAVASSSDNINFQISNTVANGAQTAGSILNIVGFGVTYSITSAAPNISSISFNGVPICSNVPPTTPTPLVTTAAPGTCNSMISVSSAWSGGFADILNTPMPTLGNSLSLNFTLSPAIQSSPTSYTMQINIIPICYPISSRTILNITDPTFTSATTAATSTLPLSSPTTTSSSCSRFVSISSSWQGGYLASLIIPISNTVKSWVIALQFSSAISILQVSNAVSSTNDNINYQLVNRDSNGVQINGSVLNSVGLSVGFPIRIPQPIISGILFNGAFVCGIAPPVTVPPPTTIPTSSTSTNQLPTKYNYMDAITKSLLFYYAQRSGRLPKKDNPISYRNNSALGDIGQKREDLTGGYYDAGDFIKFSFPMAATTTIVAWSIIDYKIGYENAGMLLVAQKMVKWATDYFIKAHVAPNQLYVQVGDGKIDHAYWGRPEEMTMPRPAFFISASNPGSDVAGETAAALAAASIVFNSTNATYSNICLDHARQLYTFAQQNLGIYSNSVPSAANFYPSSGFTDELAWAAIWLYRATNNINYLNDATRFYTTYSLMRFPNDFSWDNKTAAVQILMAKITGRSQYMTVVRSFCDAKMTQVKTPKGLLFQNNVGSLRYAANIAFLCLQAADMNLPNSLGYRQFAQQQIHYALGDTGRSYVVGFGANSPTRPSHRSSSCPNMPSTCDWSTYSSSVPNYQTLYGALVGGPDKNDESYIDSRSSEFNRVGCDYNAEFQASLAGLQSLAFLGIFN